MSTPETDSKISRTAFFFLDQSLTLLDVPEERPDRQHLSVSFGGAQAYSKHTRSASHASSNRTVIAEDSDVERKSAAFRRRRTQVAVVKLSWLDCFKGFLFGPKGVKQKLAATVKLADVEDADVDVSNIAFP